MSTDLTLRAAIEAFYAANAKYFGDRDKTPEAEIFFRHHDIAHVIFDCDTSIVDEGKVKVWSIFGTTLGFWKHIKGYSEADAFSLFKMYSWSHVLKSVFKLILIMPRVMIRARSMNKPWPWSSYEEYLDQPITQIRAEFNIKPL